MTENLILNNFKPDSPRLGKAVFAERLAKFAPKLWWFASKGYVPHYYQLLFHTMREPRDTLVRYRHLVAGRRGGKTLSAAWEVLFYALHPEIFHMDAHGKEDDRPLHIWVLTKDYPMGRTAWRIFERCMRDSGLVLGTDYKRNLGDKFFEFSNGSFIEFKTADDPQSLRGAGLDMLWIDEAAFISNKDAWEASRPALSDHQGIVVTTTTPFGRNWFYNTFWNDKALESHRHGRVEYWSIQNPYFPREEWDEVKQSYHPLLFKREYMASFDAMIGVELQGDWLHYYDWKDIPRDAKTDRWKLKLFMGVDPAISLADDADRFAMALVGVTEAGQAYLIDQYADRIPFPDQVNKIIEWYSRWQDKGLQVIGIESNAYQAALEQQVSRMGPMAPIIPVISKGKKVERIMRMSPLFQYGKIKIRKEHHDFINEWINYDSTLKNPEDDCLDSVEIALSTASVLLPMHDNKRVYDPSERPLTDMNDLARRYAPGGDLFSSRRGSYDPDFGEDY